MTTSLDACLNRVIRRDIQSMHAYAVQPSAGMVKLDTMENPHRLPPALQQALGERLGRIAINRYPAECTEDLRRALAAHADMPEGCALTLGNGSDELITMLRQFEREGFPAFEAEWRASDSLFNAPVRVLSASETINGIARGVSSDGALLVEVNGQVQRFMSGDVSLRAALAKS